MGHTTDSRGALTATPTPTQTVADLQAGYDRVEQIGGLLKGSASDRGALTGAAVADGWLFAQPNGLLQRVPGGWRLVGSHQKVVSRTMSATNQFSDRTAYTDFPVTADAAALQIQFEKVASESKLVLDVRAAANLASGLEQDIYIALNIALVGGSAADYQVARYRFPTATNRQNITGIVEVVGLGAGTYTIKPRVRSSSAAQVLFTASDHLHYSVTETM